MKSLTGWMLAIAMVAGSSGVAQQGDPELNGLIEQYVSAYNKGDARALAALYMEDAIRISAGDQPLKGRQAIEASAAERFAGKWKGAKLTVRPGRTVSSGADVRVQEGTWEVSGAVGVPTRGHYLNTYTRQGGQWKIAGNASFPEATPSR